MYKDWLAPQFAQRHRTLPCQRKAEIGRELPRLNSFAGQRRPGIKDKMLNAEVWEIVLGRVFLLLAIHSGIDFSDVSSHDVPLKVKMRYAIPEISDASPRKWFPMFPSQRDRDLSLAHCGRMDPLRSEGRTMDYG